MDPEKDVMVGRPRPKRHPVIVYHEVGKAPLRSCSPVLPNDQTFGIHNKRDAEGAGAVILQWKSHEPSKQTTGNERSFLELNKRAASANCTTARQFGQFRSTHGSTRSPSRARPRSTSPHKDRTAALTYNSDFAFGRVTKPEVSVSELICGKFASEWVEAQTNIWAKRDQKKRRHQESSVARRKAAMDSAVDKSKVAASMPYAAAASYQDFGMSASADSVGGRNGARFTMKQFRKVPARTVNHNPGYVPAAKLKPLKNPPHRAATAEPPAAAGLM